jgi:hypothetical protein
MTSKELSNNNLKYENMLQVTNCKERPPIKR